MKLRSNPTRINPVSMPYDVGGNDPVYLLPGKYLPSGQIVSAVEDAYRESFADVDAVTDELITHVVSGAAFSLFAFALWDDPRVEWEAKFDPDDVLELRGKDLKDACEAISGELMQTRTMRLGIDFGRLAKATMKAVRGEPDTDPSESPEGE